MNAQGTLILIGGAIACALIYGADLVKYFKADDDLGFNVTVIAIFGTMLPFLGFAMIMSS